MKGRPQTVSCSANQSRREQRSPHVARAGFSLLEVLIVVAIIFVLATMYLGFGSRDHQKQRQHNCRNNLQKIYVAMEIYANERGGQFPVIAGAPSSTEPLNLLVPRYTADTAVFVCPGSKDPELTGATTLLAKKISYAYYMGRIRNDASEPLMSDEQVNTLPKVVGQAVFSASGKAPGNNHHKYGGNFLFCDGRTEQSPTQTPFPLGLTPGVVLLNP